MAHLLRILILVATLATCALNASGANVLRGRHAMIEAPDGMSYDSALSAKMGMDVYRSRDNTILFAIGPQPPKTGVSALTLTAVLAGTSAGSVVKVNDRGVYAAFDGTRKRVFGVCQADGPMPVVLIIGDIARADALRYIATLCPAK